MKLSKLQSGRSFSHYSQPLHSPFTLVVPASAKSEQYLSEGKDELKSVEDSCCGRSRTRWESLMHTKMARAYPRKKRMPGRIVILLYSIDKSAPQKCSLRSFAFIAIWMYSSENHSLT